MSVGLQLILSTTLAAAAPACSWAHPGANPYRGDPVRALADFDLPETTRRELRALMAAHRPTDVVTITRDDIVGAHSYTGLRQMHSGGGRVCHGDVDRSAWSAKRRERALVYCAGDACVIVPRICHNVALVSRRPDRAAEEGPIDIEPAAGPPAGGPPTSEASDSGPPADQLLPPPAVAVAPPAGPELPDLTGAGGEAGSDEGGWAFGGAPIEAGPIGGGELPCCELGPGGPGVPGAPPVAPPPAVPEAPAWMLLVAGLALVLRRCGQRR